MFSRLLLTVACLGQVLGIVVLSPRSALASASVPFTEGFESGTFSNYWTVTGTSSYRSQVTTANGPHTGSYQLTMDSSVSSSYARNEVTLTIDLASYTNVVLSFWAKEFADEPNGPPPSPFIGGADFDGVAISVDGNTWWEVQDLRNLSGTWAQLTVSLDAAMAAHGLTYNSTFRIRFNQYDNFPISGGDGIAIDDISITAARPLLLTVPAVVTEGAGVLQGMVSLPLPPTNDVTVTLTSSDTSEVTVPGSVVVLTGQSNAVFNVTVVNDAELDGTQTAIVTASAPGYPTAQANIAVNDNEVGVLHVSLPASASESAGSVAGTVFVNASVSTSVTVSLSSSDTTEVTVPGTVTILPGQTSAVFTATIVNDNLIDGPQPATVTAHVVNWTDGGATISVLDDENTNLTVSLPAFAREGDGTLTNVGTIRISGTLASSLTINLQSSDTSELTVPSSATILAGQTSVVFNVTMVDDSIIDGTQPATVTASATGFANGNATMSVLDNDVHHFVWAAISSPKTGNVPFAVTVTAQDLNGAVISNYIGTALLSGAGDIGSVIVSPPSAGTFTNGSWAGSVTVGNVASAVQLTANDGNGHTGQSSPFNVVSLALHHFNWTTVGATQHVDMPFSSTITARDFANNPVTGFVGSVSLSARSTNTLTQVGYYVNQRPWPLAAGSHDCRTQVVYPQSLIGGPQRFAALALDVAGAPSGTLSNWTIRLKHVPFGDYGWGYIWQSTGWTVVYQNNEVITNTGYVKFNFQTPFDYDGVQSLLVDFSFNNSSAGGDGSCHYTYTGGARTMNYQSNSTDGDPLLWDGYTPSANVNGEYPNIQLIGYTPYDMSPTNSGNFAGAAWTGPLMVQAAGSNMLLHAQDTLGHTGDCNLFTTVYDGALSLTAPTVATEGAGILTGAGKITVTPVPTSNFVVSLVSSNPASVTLPATVTIPAGQSNVVFDVTILDDVVLNGSRAVALRAYVPAYVPGFASIVVHDNDPATLSVSMPASAMEGDGVLTNAGTVFVSGPVGTNVVVSISCSDTSEVVVPPSVMILAGQTSAVFNVSIVDDNLIDGPQSATVTAQVTNWTSGNAAITVYDNEATNLTLTLWQGIYWEGTGSNTYGGQIAIAAPYPSNLVVNLQSLDTTELTVPATVMIPAGATSAGFTVYVVDDTIVDGTQTGTVVATAAGFASSSAFLQILDNEPYTYTWATITGSKQAGSGFTTDLIVYNVGGVAIQTVTTPTILTGVGDHGPVVCTPTNLGFDSNGERYGQVVVYTADTNVRLTASDGNGHSGTSTPFNVYPGPLDHFSIGTVGATQSVGVAFPVTVTARDIGNNVTTNFAGATGLSGVIGRITTPVLLYDTSSAKRFTKAVNNLLLSPQSFSDLPSFATALSAANPSNSLVIADGSGTPTSMDWTSVVNFVTVGGRVIFEYWNMQSYPYYCNAFNAVQVANVEGPMPIYNWGGSPFFAGLTNPVPMGSPFIWDWGDSFNATNGGVAVGGYTNAPGAANQAALILGNSGRTILNGFMVDNLAVEGDAVRLAENEIQYFLGPLPVTVISPTNTGNFTSGVWSGNVTVVAGASNIVLRVDDGAGHSATGNVFSALTTADLRVTGLSDSPDPVTAGSNLTYSVAIKNQGPEYATGVTLVDALPVGLDFVSAAASQGTCTNFGNTAVCNLGVLSNGVSATATIVARPWWASLITNTVSVTGGVIDLIPSNNSTSTVTTVTGTAALSVTPTSALVSTGFFGGPFTPASQDYVVTNSGTALLAWTASNAVPWISLSSTNGTLVPRATASLTVSIPTNSLAAGSYTGTVNIVNQTNGIGTTNRTVALTVRPVPVATPQTVTMSEDTLAIITLSGTDPESRPLAEIVTVLPANGILYQTLDGVTTNTIIGSVPAVVTNATGKVIYRPPHDAFGNGYGNFQFKVNNGVVDSTPALVTVNVTNINDAPVAVNDKVNIWRGTLSVSFNVLTNDFDVDGDTLTIASYTTPTRGSLTQTGNGQFTYQPSVLFTNGSDLFSYTVHDGHGGTNAAQVILRVHGHYLDGGDWPTFGNGPSHTGYWPGLIGTNLFMASWSNSFPTSINPIAVGGGGMYVTLPTFSSYDQTPFYLAALNPQTGQQLWRYDFANNSAWGMSPPTYADGKVYTQRTNGGYDSQLWCISTNGSSLWSAYWDAQGGRYYAPAVSGDGVWIGGGAYSGMYGFNTNGSQRFFFDPPELHQEYAGWTPTYYQGTVYSWLVGMFRAHNPTNGSELWSINIGGGYTISAIEDGRAFVMQPKLYAIDLNTHAILWTQQVNFAGSPAVHNGIVYGIISNDVRSYRAADGLFLGSYTVTNDIGLSFQPIVTDDSLLIASSTATYIFDLPTRQLRQTIPFGGTLSLASGRLYITDAQQIRTYVLNEPATDLAIAGSGAPEPVIVGSNLVYTVIVSNRGPNLAQATILTDVLPLGLSFVSVTCSSGACVQSNGLITCSLGILTNNIGATATIVVVPNVAGVVSNWFNTSASTSDPVATNSLVLLLTHVTFPPGQDADGDGLPDAWEMQYFGATNAPNGCASCDSDGDGQSNLQEYLAGTNPTNSASALRITSIRLLGTNTIITWAAVGGRTNILQGGAGDLDHNNPVYSNLFWDMSEPIIIPGTGEVITNFLDDGTWWGDYSNWPTHYYRIRLVP